MSDVLRGEGVTRVFPAPRGDVTAERDARRCGARGAVLALHREDGADERGQLLLDAQAEGTPLA